MFVLKNIQLFNKLQSEIIGMDLQMENPFACATCKKAFSQPKALHRHVELYHRAKASVSEVFEEMEGRNQSVDNNFDIGQFPSLGASHDNFGLDSSAQDLSPNNFTSFEGSPDRRKNLFSCRYCGKRFKCQSDTSRHERVHTGEKPFSCLYCPEKFSRSYSLKEHAMKHKGK